VSDQRVPAHTDDGLLAILADAARTGRQPNRSELDGCRRFGTRAAGAGIPVRTVVAGHLSAAERALAGLPGIADAASAADARTAARSVLAALHRALAAVLDGYEDSHRLAARVAEVARRACVGAWPLCRGGPVPTA